MRLHMTMEAPLNESDLVPVLQFLCMEGAFLALHPALAWAYKHTMHFCSIHEVS